MRVWTIQTAAVLSALSAGKVWRAFNVPAEPAWAPAYQWMAQAMRQRLGSPDTRAQMPIWVWCQWRGATRARPDLRARGHLPAGTPGVRIELELDESRVLRSDFELWHYVLNGWYLPGSLADEREFDERPDRHRIVPSWQRIFDLGWRNRRYTAAHTAKSIQGVTWELRPGDVRDATDFMAR
jgi:Domain of unknown function (DUF3841)